MAAQVDEELAFHLAMRAEELEARGMSPERARAEALRRMGDLDRVRGACRALGEAKERDMQRAEWLSELGQDVRFGARQLARTRALTLVAALTIALGVGPTSAIFSVVDAVVLRALPFDRSLAGLLYGVTPSDPAPVAGVVVVLTASAVAASLAPAARAARVDPAAAMRG